MIPAVVLAAGKSSRMGRTKALLPLGSSGETFLARVIRVLREGGADAVVVVIGGDAAAVRASLPRDDSHVSSVENPRYEEGQLSSLLVGLAAVEQRHDKVDAVMVTLVDLPLIGKLFGQTRTQDEKRDLLILVTPHIIDDGAPIPGTPSNSMPPATR